MTIKIQPYLPETSPSESFTFSDNPQGFNSEATVDNETTPLPFTNRNITVGRVNTPQRNTIFNGFFRGQNYKEEMNDLAEIAFKNELLELVYDDGRRYIGTTQSLQPQTTGQNPLRVSYTYVFSPAVTILFDQNTKNLTGTNQGSMETYIEVISGTVTSGSSDVVISDNHGNQVTLSSDAFTTGDTVKYFLVQLEDVGDNTKATEYGRFTVNSTNKSNFRTQTGQNVLRLDPGEDATNISTTNLGSVTGQFRDGYFY